MKLIKIKAFNYSELNEKAKDQFIHEMYDCPFEYDCEDENGETILKYDYFGDWDSFYQNEFCDSNEYLFDKNGNIISHLEEDS